MLSPNAPKTSESGTPKPPPTMVAVKRRADLKRAQEEKAAGVNARKTIEAGTRAKSQNCDYEDEADSDSEYEPLRISRYADQQGKAADEQGGAGPSQGDTSNVPLAQENTEGDAGTTGGGGAKPSKGVSTEMQDSGTGKERSVPNLSGKAQSGKCSEKKRE